MTFGLLEVQNFLTVTFLNDEVYPVYMKLYVVLIIFENTCEYYYKNRINLRRVFELLILNIFETALFWGLLKLQLMYSASCFDYMQSLYTHMFEQSYV